MKKPAADAVHNKPLGRVTQIGGYFRGIFNEPLGYITIALLFLAVYLISGFWMPQYLRESGRGNTNILELFFGVTQLRHLDICIVLT